MLRQKCGQQSPFTLKCLPDASLLGEEIVVWGKFDLLILKLSTSKNTPFPRLGLLMENLETFLDFRFDHIKYPPPPPQKLKLLMENFAVWRRLPSLLEFISVFESTVGNLITCSYSLSIKEIFFTIVKSCITNEGYLFHNGAKIIDWCLVEVSMQFLATCFGTWRGPVQKHISSYSTQVHMLLSYIIWIKVQVTFSGHIGCTMWWPCWNIIVQPKQQFC